MKALDSNFVYIKEMIDIGVLKWYKLTLSEVLVLENDIKLKRTLHGAWINDTTATNATAGQQGAKQPSPTSESPIIR